MALNASSHNSTGEKTAPNTAPPPELGADVKKDILGAAEHDATGQHAPGRENEKGVEKKEKSAKELEKDEPNGEAIGKTLHKLGAATSKSADKCDDEKVADQLRKLGEALTKSGQE